MVMNGDIDWLKLYKNWQQKQTDYFAAQRALDDAMSRYLHAEGAPPTMGALKRTGDLRHQMLEARKSLESFIEAHAVDGRKKGNLPRHE